MEQSSISQSPAATSEEVPSSLASTERTLCAPTLTEFTVDVDSDLRQFPVAQPNCTQLEPKAELKIFFSTFLTIFLAELGDKTQMATLLMTAESHQPWVVFAGAGAALVATSLLGVWLGCWLAKRVSPKTLEKSAGVLLLLVAAQLAWEVFHL